MAAQLKDDSIEAGEKRRQGLLFKKDTIQTISYNILNNC